MDSVAPVYEINIYVPESYGERNKLEYEKEAFGFVFIYGRFLYMQGLLSLLKRHV